MRRLRVSPASFTLGTPFVVLRPPRLAVEPAAYTYTGRLPLRRGLRTAAELAILEGPICSMAGLVRIATPIPVRLWTGVGDLPVSNSVFDPDGSIYLGAGRIIDLPTFQRLVNGIAERITLTLTGVTDDMRALAYEEADDVRGVVVRLGIALLDDNWQQTGSVWWQRQGRVDVIETENKPGERERIKTISFSLGSKLTGRRIPGSGAYTNADQQSRPGSEDDRFCERTPLMTQHTVIKWPNF